MSDRILPIVDELNQPFWDSCRDGALSVQRCTACNQLRYPIAPVCPGCLGREWTWQQLAGGGVVHTFAVFRHAYHDAWRALVPYTVAIVELDEGVMMIADVAGIAPDDVSVGMRLRVDFVQATDELRIPRFVPVEA